MRRTAVATSRGRGVAGSAEGRLDRGVVQVRTFTVPTLGRVTVGIGDGRLLVLGFAKDEGEDLDLAHFRRAGWTVADTGHALHARMATELAAYAAGTLRAFTVPWGLPLATPFTERVLTACAAIPWGRTATYGDLAEIAGSPRAYQAVGQVMCRNPLPIVVPCHRVLANNGLGGYTPGLKWKRVLLGIEGCLLYTSPSPRD